MTPLLDVHVKPRARVAGLGERTAEGRLTVAVRAAPEDGAANREVVATVARALGVAPAQVAVVRGATARRKTLRVDGVSSDALDRLGRNTTQSGSTR